MSSFCVYVQCVCTVCVCVCVCCLRVYPLSVCFCLLLSSGPEEPGAGEDEHRELPPRHHCTHQEARPQVPARIQRAERHSE